MVKFKLSNIIFILPVEIKKQEDNDILSLQLRYLLKYFLVKIRVIEHGAEARANIPEDLGNKIEYFFIKTKWISEIVKNIKTIEEEVICFIDYNIFLFLIQYLTASAVMAKKQADAILPHDGNMIKVLPEKQKIFEEKLTFLGGEQITNIENYYRRTHIGNLFIRRDVFNEVQIDDEFETQEIRYFYFLKNLLEKNKSIYQIGYPCFLIGGEAECNNFSHDIALGEKKNESI